MRAASPDDEGVAGTQVFQARLRLRAVGFGSGGDVLVDLQAVLGGQGVELQLRILVGGADPGVADLVSHQRTLSKPGFGAML
jgi:hypothetical protein